MLRVVPFLIFGVVLGADERTERMTERLAEEAGAFQRVAPELLGRETMEQKALKARPRFRIRVGDQAEWQVRTLVSEYGYTTFADGALHELRQVVTVDGKAVKNKGPQELARIITTADEKRKQELLKSFRDYGLLGAVNDFGQIILLFTPRGIGRYEFVFREAANVEGIAALVWDYRQIDGPNALTVVEARREAVQQVRMEGQVWVRADDYLPLRVTVTSTQNQDGQTVRHEATVDYARSEFGAVLPVRTRHREVWDERAVAENEVRYEDFKRFGQK